jgi:pilus assembly protein CpaB
MAIVLGLVAAYVVRQALQKPPVAALPAPPPPAPEPKVPVVFALRSMGKNTQVTSRDIFVQMMPLTVKAANGSIKNYNLAEGRIVKEPIRAGQAMREEYLLPLGEGLPDLAERLPAGHRAVTISVEGAATGGRRLAEGDHVDISLTVEGTHPDLGEVTTRTLLRQVLIVDAKQDYPRARGVDRNKLLKRDDSELTVAVTSADANKLIVAQRTGTLAVTLVPAADADGAAPDSDDTINRRQLLGLKEVPPVRKYTLEKWSGSTVSRMEWSDDRVREARDMKAGMGIRGGQTTSIDGRSPYAPSGVTLPTSVLSVQPQMEVSTGADKAAPLGDPEAVKASAESPLTAIN